MAKHMYLFFFKFDSVLYFTICKYLPYKLH